MHLVLLEVFSHCIVFCTALALPPIYSGADESNGL